MLFSRVNFVFKVLPAAGDLVPHLLTCFILLLLYNVVFFGGSYQVFCNVLMVEDIADDDDFFSMGGNSISAAQVAHKLQIDMRLLYSFPSPYKLQHALRDTDVLSNCISGSAPEHPIVEIVRENSLGGGLFLLSGELKSQHLMKKFVNKRVNLLHESRAGSADQESVAGGSKMQEEFESTALSYSLLQLSGNAAFGRCNKVMYGEKLEFGDSSISYDASEYKNGFMRELWAVPMELCVDASPLVVLKDSALYIFIGSHAGLFMCVDALR